MDSNQIPNRDLVFNLVKQVPKGKISSYGRIAKRTGINPRIVGFIMSGISPKEADEQNIPWHRIVDRNGFISSSKLGEKGLTQEAMLKAEGLEIKNFQIKDFEGLWWDF